MSTPTESSTVHGAPRGRRPWRRRQAIEPPTALTVALGAIWIIDGLLQLQPAQFTSGFAVGIEMNAMAQPSAIAHLELAFGRLTSLAPASWTVLIAMTQLILGASMLVGRTRRQALLASIPWAIAVWVLGEGLGGIATGFAILPTGAPGAALAYAVLACLLLRDGDSTDPIRTRRRYKPVWSAFLLAGATLQLSSRVPSALVLRANFNESSGGEPGVLAAMDHRLADLTGGHPAATTAVVVFLELLLACVPWVSHRRWALLCTLAVLLAMWIAGENAGGLLTWSASDVGISPLLAMLALGAFDVRGTTRVPVRPALGSADLKTSKSWPQHATVLVEA
jgi:hypothetical protein